jgi:uncharacterized protein with NRDE domain
MCVLAFAWRAHPRWRMVVAGNRDELHSRPSAPLARWPTPDHVLAGRDLQSGGTWLGVSEQGRFAVITNVRGPGTLGVDRLSRGALVSGFLTGERDYAVADLSKFNPFNLIEVGADGAAFLTNQPEPMRGALAPGIYGLSNGALDEPWPKTMQLKSRLLEWIVTEDGRPETLLQALREETVPRIGIQPALESDVEQEPRSSPVFLRHPIYGTRCSTVVAIGDDGEGVIVERRYSPAGAVTGETTLPFVCDVPGARA